MATRKQRKRSQKGRRHEYETVWVDSEGNELEEPPDDVPAPAPRDTKAKPQSQPKRQQQGSSRATRTPLPPSWRRAAKRSVLLGLLIFVVFSFLNSKNGSSAYISAFLLALMYTALFIPFTYYVDRFAYNRFLRKTGEQPQKQPRKR